MPALTHPSSSWPYGRLGLSQLCRHRGNWLFHCITKCLWLQQSQGLCHGCPGEEEQRRRRKEPSSCLCPFSMSKVDYVLAAQCHTHLLVQRKRTWDKTRLRILGTTPALSSGIDFIPNHSPTSASVERNHYSPGAQLVHSLSSLSSPVSWSSAVTLLQGSSKCLAASQVS